MEKIYHKTAKAECNIYATNLDLTHGEMCAGPTSLAGRCQAAECRSVVALRIRMVCGGAKWRDREQRHPIIVVSAAKWTAQIIRGPLRLHRDFADGEGLGNMGLGGNRARVCPRFVSSINLKKTRLPHRGEGSREGLSPIRSRGRNRARVYSWILSMGQRACGPSPGTPCG